MRARRQHLDLHVRGEVLGNVSGVLLGAAVDVGAVPLNDDRDLHSSSGTFGDAGESGVAGESGDYRVRIGWLNRVRIECVG